MFEMLFSFLRNNWCKVLVRSYKVYLDPGSASVLLQLIIGAIAGALLTIKIYWQKFKNIFSSWRKINRRRKVDNHDS